MQQGVIDFPSPLIPSTPLSRRTRATLLGALCIALVLAALGLWSAMATPLTNLGSPQQMQRSGAYEQWAKGAVIVLVRHAERCDRSHGACLGDPSGITVAGSQAADALGDGLQRLGLASTDTLVSPEVRTRQTARFIFDNPVTPQPWLARCDSSFAQAALDHKRAGRNLVLVTHSGCIDQFERQLGVAAGERSAAYASALFVTLDEAGKPRILGQIQANAWRNLGKGRQA
jgi:phosphohistidine phosphatase SixA